MLNILVWIARSKHDIGNGFVVALKLFFFFFVVFLQRAGCITLAI